MAIIASRALWPSLSGTDAEGPFRCLSQNSLLFGPGKVVSIRTVDARQTRAPIKKLTRGIATLEKEHGTGRRTRML